MKKLLAILLTVLMLWSVSASLVSAQDNIATQIGTTTEEVRSYLGVLLDSAVDILASDDIITYTDESCEALEQAVGEGYGVYYNPEATAEELSIQVDKVKNAIDNMKKKTVSQEAQNYLISAMIKAESEVGVEMNYTEDSWFLFADAFDKAKETQQMGTTDEEFIAAADTLLAAINDLKPVDSSIVSARAYLMDIIVFAYGVLESNVNYTEESVKTLENAIVRAEELYYSYSATSRELYFEADTLVNVINYMDVIEISPDVIAYLSDIIAYADAQVSDESDYTTDSWSVYIDAYLEAVKVLNTGKSNEEYTTAANNLDVAIRGLMLIDRGIIEAREYLQTVINSAYQMLQSAVKYTAASVKALEDAIIAANAVYLNENATQQELYDEADKLEDAMAAMEKIVISEEAQNSLLQAIKTADGSVGAEYEYTQDSWNAFIEAYQKAVEILDKGENDKEYKEAAKALNDAVSKLEQSSAGKDDALNVLYRTIESAQMIMNDGQRYTAESLKVLATEINSASQVYDDENATEQEIYDAVYNLESAMNSMEKIEISIEVYDYLSEVLAKAELIVTSDEEYTPDSWSNFEKAYEDALDVLANGESDEEYTSAADALNSAIDNLEIVEIPTVPATIKAALMKAILSAKTQVDLSLDYTLESLKEFNDAKEFALSVYNNSNSEEEFALATDRLLAAIENLQIATVNILLGDVDKDGKVTIKDATLIQKTVAGITTLDERSTLAADSNRDDVVNVRDATEIQKSIAGLKSCEDIGKEIQIPVNGSPDEEISKDETPDEENPDIQIPDEPYSIDYTIAYEFRVGPYEGGWENINLIVRSPQELQAVIDKMDYDYYYRNEDIFPEAYDEAFFEENAVIVSLYLVGGSECSQWIFSATVDGTFLILDRAVFRPEIYPPDMNYQCMYIEVKKADIHHITQVVDYKDLFPNGA